MYLIKEVEFLTFETKNRFLETYNIKNKIIVKVKVKLEDDLLKKIIERLAIFSPVHCWNYKRMNVCEKNIKKRFTLREPVKHWDTLLIYIVS